MKILVLSDSHSSLIFMRYCIDRVKPDHVIHLGDHYDDGQAMAQEYPHIRFHQVPGNCDNCRSDPTLPDTMCYSIGGVRMYMTHGHRHAVKSGMGHLLAEARKVNAQIVLFGHTHDGLCFYENEQWVLNPGTCKGFGGNAGIIDIKDGKISACTLVGQADLEEY